MRCNSLSVTDYLLEFRDRDLVAGDHRLDQRPAAGAHPVADRKDGRHHRAAGMHRALAEAVVELDAMGCRAAQEGGIEQIGAAHASRHRDVSVAAHGRHHGFGARGDMDHAITIRTLVFRGDEYSYQAGGGIVADSVPESEHDEVLAKSAAVARALELAEEGL